MEKKRYHVVEIDKLEGTRKDYTIRPFKTRKAAENLIYYCRVSESFRSEKRGWVRFDCEVRELA